MTPCHCRFRFRSLNRHSHLLKTLGSLSPRFEAYNSRIVVRKAIRAVRVHYKVVSHEDDGQARKE